MVVGKELRGSAALVRGLTNIKLVLALAKEVRIEVLADWVARSRVLVEQDTE